MVLGVFIESVFSDRLWLSLSLALAKLNNYFCPPALNEGCGKSVFHSLNSLDKINLQVINSRQHARFLEEFILLNLVFLLRLIKHTLCFEQLYGCLFQPLYTCTWTNLSVTYSRQSSG